ncbi:MAG: phospho-N-acetylmuramoyl-pentapeptide-transferase [Acidobacteria bacterium]|nr:phospho-N-acetylmuramoyl-pentapeptide-transferase [Acidobacteriota bacterium]
MLYYLFRFLFEKFPELGFLRLFNYISFRSIGAALTSITIVLIFARYFISYFHKKQYLDFARETGIPSASDKSGTPTMGGILIAISFISSSILWAPLDNGFVVLAVVSFAYFCFLGYLDDKAKLKAKSGEGGYSERFKLILQGVFSLVFVLIIFSNLSPIPESERANIYVPFVKYPLFNSFWIYGIFVFFYFIAVSNSVNITDGLDGLAIVPSTFVVSVLGIFAYIIGNALQSKYLQFPHYPGAGELTVLASCFEWAAIGFLWYNAYPAQIFMGDTGSLAIGGMIASLSVLLKQELLFPLLGGLFVAEAFTSQIQDKLGVNFLGKRIFHRAPLHHELQYRGLAENKVVVRLWIISGILALLAIATIKVR